MCVLYGDLYLFLLSYYLGWDFWVNLNDSISSGYSHLTPDLNGKTCGILPLSIFRFKEIVFGKYLYKV